MKEMTNDELPLGWVETALGALGSVGSSKRVHQQDWKSQGVPFFRAREIAELSRNGTVDNDLFISEELFQELSKEAFVPSSGDVMITGVGTIGVPYVVKEKDRFYFKDASVLIFKNDHGLESRYLFFFLKSKSCQQWIKEGSTGTTVDTLTIGRAREIPIPIAPLAEQKRIADKLEAVLGRVDACRARLDRVPDLLKRFRQSVLAAATSGQLTEDWREENETTTDAEAALCAVEAKRSGKLRVQKSEGSFEDINLFDLPTGWNWVKNHRLAVDASNAICAGPFGTIFKAKDFRDEGVPIIFLRHVGEGKYLTKKPGYMDREVWHSQHQEYSVHGGELLVTKLGDPPGTACIYPGGIGVAMVTPDVMKMEVDGLVAHTKFLMFFFNSPLCKDLVEEMAFGATRLRIDLTMFKNFPIPLPPLAEQAEIVRRVEALFALADRIEARLTAARAQVERLTPATLSKAFRGDLVPQVPNDEPASKLLKRVRTMVSPGAKPKKPVWC